MAALRLGFLLLLFGFAILAPAGAAPVRWVNPPERKFPGLAHQTFKSASMGREVGYNIYLPPGYAERPQDRFPVVYHLAGMGDTESSELELVPVLDASIRNRSLSPMIVVFAHGGDISFYSDSREAGIMGESVIIRDLIPQIDAHYRTIATRAGRGLQGFSMGGFGALKLGFKHPQQFGSIVAYTAGLYDGAMMKSKLDKVLKPMFGNEPARFDADAPAHWLKTNAEKIRGRMSIRLVVGSKEMLLELCRRMHGLLQQEKIPHEYEEIRGVGHKPADMTARDGLKGLLFHARAFSGGGRAAD